MLWISAATVASGLAVQVAHHPGSRPSEIPTLLHSPPALPGALAQPPWIAENPAEGLPASHWKLWRAGMECQRVLSGFYSFSLSPPVAVSVAASNHFGRLP